MVKIWDPFEYHLNSVLVQTLKTHIFAKFCIKFPAFSSFLQLFQLFCTKNIEKTYFDQRLNPSTPTLVKTYNMANTFIHFWLIGGIYSLLYDLVLFSDWFQHWTGQDRSCSCGTNLWRRKSRLFLWRIFGKFYIFHFSFSVTWTFFSY